MALSNTPGVWRWERRGDRWWRIHDVLNIEDGPHDFGDAAPPCPYVRTSDEGTSYCSLGTA